MSTATIKMGAAVLIAKWGLVSPIRTVKDAVTQGTQIDTGAVARALPLRARTVKRLGRTVFLITHIPTIIVPITDPRFVDAVSIVTEEMSRRAGLRNTASVLVGPVDTVWMPVTLPGVRDACTVSLALELIRVAHAGRPGGAACLVRVVPAVVNPIAAVPAVNARTPIGTFELGTRTV